MFRVFLTAFFVATISAAPLFGCQQTEDSQSFRPGDLIPRVVALENPQQSYALAATLARDLRLRAEREKKPERVRVFKRALASVFIGSLESGRDALDKKDFRRAESYFACATEANPESEWSFRNLAIARASSGDRKGALEALRSARKFTKDPSAFSDWLTQEPAFVRLQSTSEYRVLREPQ